MVRSKGRNKRRRQQKGVIYCINCKDCDMKYIGETGKLLKERVKQHKSDVKYGRETNAILKHVKEKGHEVNWEEVIVLEHEDRMWPRKWKEAWWIEKEGEEKLMNWTKGISINKEWKHIIDKYREMYVKLCD